VDGLAGSETGIGVALGLFLNTARFYKGGNKYKFCSSRCLSLKTMDTGPQVMKQRHH
jgi:hypothetical protein